MKRRLTNISTFKFTGENGDYIVNIERAKNDIYGNPRWKAIITDCNSFDFVYEQTSSFVYTFGGHYYDTRDEAQWILTEHLKSNGFSRESKFVDGSVFSKEDWECDFEREMECDGYENLIFAITGNDELQEFGNTKLLDIINGHYYDEELGYDYDVEQEMEKVFGMKFEDHEMYGYVQREWNRLYIPVGTPKEKIDYIETLYMGKYDPYGNNEQIVIVPHSISWKGEDAVKKYIEKETGLKNVVVNMGDED